jgi:hypothetical protein
LSIGGIDRQKAAELVLQCDGRKGTDRFVEAQVVPPITMRDFKKIVYDPSLSRPVKASGLVGKAARLSRRLLDEYLKSLDGKIEVEIADGASATK